MKAHAVSTGCRRAGLAAVLFLSAVSALAQGAAAPLVVLARIDGPIVAPTRDYVARALSRAEAQHATCFLLEMDTPGGELQASRAIIQRFLNARTPVVVYIAPRGARAASAGAMVSLAANVLAMAPGTNIGAAHPVDQEGQNITGDMRDKVVNDAAAFMRSVAQTRGKSARWAEDIVRKSISNSETEARALGIADIIASDRADLLRQLDGRRVATAAGSATISTLHAHVEVEELTWIEKLLLVLFDPNVALILGLIAAYGIITEVTNPGAIFPGVVGGIALVLTLYSFSVLSASGTGIALLLLALVLLIVDLYAPTHGVLTAGGLIAFVTGALLLFSNSPIGVGVSLTVVITLAVITAAFFGLVLAAVVRSHRRAPGSGPEKLIGARGEARTDLDPRGTVFLDGAHWTAENTGAAPIHRGDAVIVEARDGLRLKVRLAEPPARSSAEREPDPGGHPPA